MDIREAINHVVDRIDLSAADMRAVMQQIMSGGATPIQIGGFLAGLRTKGETVAEIAAAAGVMRELAMRVEVAPERLVDTAGTGGDNSGTFNVSTASAFVVAAAGGRVAKHGNRSVSSQSGSADVLEALGVRTELPPEQVARCIAEAGVGFLFAPAFHAAAKYAAAPRRELGTRTLFNLLGPLTNPAGAPHQLLGVFASRWVEPLARVLGDLGSRHVLVVHGMSGLDEIALDGETLVGELKNGAVHEYSIRPRDFGIEERDVSVLKVADPAESKERVIQALQGTPGPSLDVVLLNAGGALYAADIVPSIAEGIARAREAVASGAARAKLDQFVKFTQSA